MSTTLQTAGSGQITDFPVWKTILAGEWSRDELEESRFSLSYSLDWSGFSVGMEPVRCFVDAAFRDRILLVPTRIDLYLATVKELTGQEKLPLQEVLNSVRKIGYSLCPPEVGPRLRLELRDQRKMGRIYVAMHPIRNQVFLLAGRVATADRDSLECTSRDQHLSGSDEVVFTKCAYHR